MKQVILALISTLGLLFVTPVAASDIVTAVAKNDEVGIVSELAYIPREVRREVLCLALNLYHEGRGSTVEDRIAIAFVTLNRLSQRTLREERTICSVVFENAQVKKGSGTKTTYQFSWVAYSEDRKLPQENQSWEDAQRLALWVFKNQDTIPDPTKGATHYYAPAALKKLGYRTPAWARFGVNKQMIGQHIYMNVPD